MTTVKKHQYDDGPQLGSAIDKCIDKIIKNQEYVSYSLEKRAITDVGNYLGELLEVDIKGKTKEGDKETNLFVKKILAEDKVTILSTKDIQERETHIYSNYINICNDLMEEAKVPKEDRLRLVECFEANSEALIFENLSAKGYISLGKKQLISYPFAKLAIKQLAIYHGLSFVLQKKKPEYFNAYLKSLRYPIYFNEYYDNFINESLDTCCQVLDEDRVNVMHAARDRITNIAKYFGEPRRCLCHGDFRSLNFLVKEKEGAVIDVIPIDYQFTNFGNPLVDFFYFLIPHSDQDFRRKHLLSLKEFYYSTLTIFLEYFDINVTDVYCKEDFELDYQEKLMFGLVMTVIIIPLVMVKPEITDNSKEVISSNKLLDGAKKRLEEMVDDYVNWGLI